MVDWESFYAALRTPGFVPGYEIQHHLGGGAFGEVYKARKTSIGKPYAIKFLKVDGDGTREGVERELEYVRVFAAIDHPNLVTIEDMGVTHGVPFLVMGYAGEETLARRIQSADLDVEAALRTFVQAARGVLALHDRRLAHFDLKPSNVFLNGDTARVGDYGLAKLLTEGRQTLSFGRGTPAYMAPEMLRNRADHRADVYSLGVVLYECLTGRLPYEPASGIGVVVRESDEPPDFPDSFPARLVPVVSRCLRLDPDQRYANVRELLEDMEQTARQGDSIVLGALTAGGSPPPLPGPPQPSPAAGVAMPSADGAPARPGAHRAAGSAGAELRQAAAELARGAREVAHSALEGVRGAAGGRSPRPPGGPLRHPSAPPPGAGAGPGGDPPANGFGVGGDVVTASTLGEDDPPAGRRSGATPSADGSPSSAAPAPGGAVSLRSEALGTIPVPPRSEAGPFGTLVEAGVLGAEMLGAVIGWPARVGTKALARSADGAARAVPGALGGVLRGLVFFAGFFLLGGLCALVLVVLFFLLAA